MIGLIAAMPEELKAITSRMENISQRKVANVEMHIGQLQGQEIVIALAGVGKVSAAIAATLLCQIYQPKALINIGVAGGLRQEQEVGDMVFSDLAVQADFDTSSIDGEEGIGKVFTADEALLAQLEAAAQSLGLRWRTGTVATQDIFMARPEDYEKLMARFPQSACSEMEGGAVAQVAAAFKIPFVIIRSLSDVAVHADNPMEFSQFAEISAKKAADLFEAFCASYY